MKLNINAKKLASIFIAGGIVFNATTIEAKAPTAEDKIAIIIADNLNKMYKSDIINRDDVIVYFNRDANCVAYAVVGTSSKFLTSERKQTADQYIYEDIHQLIGTPNIDELEHGYKPIYEVRETHVYNEQDDTYSINIENFVSGYEDVYFDSTAEEHLKEKCQSSKIKQR